MCRGDSCASKYVRVLGVGKAFCNQIPAINNIPSTFEDDTVDPHPEIFPLGTKSRVRKPEARTPFGASRNFFSLTLINWLYSKMAAHVLTLAAQSNLTLCKTKVMYLVSGKIAKFKLPIIEVT